MTNENTALRTPRLDFARTAPAAFRALIALTAAVRQDLDPALTALVALGSTPTRHRHAPVDTGAAQRAA
ncbi:hypothetical protein ACFYNZ_03160 [Streptomyces kebangsaanensis]|uniref:Uncharacterized protein n=1 Tax=Streptomyces kebangsaanensis TaxID=864058 RepID=A0ABW6KPX5_9ACTN